MGVHKTVITIEKERLSVDCNDFLISILNQGDVDDNEIYC